MGTMQNHYFKKWLFIGLAIFLPHFTTAQKADQLLQLADSLYNQRKYTQSFEIYHDYFEKESKASPAMLLKMAYIEEGANNYTEALYYLNIYYDITFNKRALRKMEELADKNALQGYKISDIEFFRNILNQNLLYIAGGLAILAWLIFSYMVHKKRKYSSQPSFSAFSIVFILLVLVLVANFNQFDDRGLLIGKDNFLMEGPSPGSKVVDVVKNGHRVRILGKKGLWYKIEWEDKTVYVRNTDLKLLKI
jgi:hypothetical protein